VADLRLTMAIGDYDQTRDIASGQVRPVGIDPTVLNMGVEETFFRFYDRLEWEVSELSMGMYTSALSRGDDRFIALPVFPSRVFRHSAIYVRADGKIRAPKDLQGARVGCPQWSQTACIYVRGWLAETVGVPLASIDWVQGGVNQAGRPEPAVLRLPADIRLQKVPDRSLNDMLLEGDLDAVISARPPRAFAAGDPRMVRLVPDYLAQEEAYLRQTGIFPIMHTIVIRRDAYTANRWIARNLFLAFEEAKARSLARLRDITVAHVPLPWVPELMERVGEAMGGGDPWPYGIEPNRATLEAFLRFAADQGTCHRHLRPEEIFAEEALIEIRV
jgi:4,5-dihydroxyphthalate decarboxylase